MSDYIVRAMAANNQVRAFAATTREMVETARAAHNTSPVATAALGRLLSAGAMMGAMLKLEETVTVKVDGDGPIGLIMAEAIQAMGYKVFACDLLEDRINLAKTKGIEAFNSNGGVNNNDISK